MTVALLLTLSAAAAVPAVLRASQERRLHLAADVRSDKRLPSRDQVVAVHVLTHEAMHLSGRLAEMVAECAALQRNAHTARLLGARPAEAAALAGASWRNIYPLMPDGYRSGGCRPGRSLDEGLADAPWLASVSS